MIPEGDPDEDGLTREQFRWLVGVSLAVGALFVLLVIGATVVSNVYDVGGDRSGPPDAEFEIRTQAAAEGVAANVTHRGGQAANPDQLVVAVDGEDRGTWRDLGGDAPGLVAQGHSLVLREVEPGDEVRLYWTDGDRRELLAAGAVQADPGG